MMNIKSLIEVFKLGLKAKEAFDKAHNEVMPLVQEYYDTIKHEEMVISYGEGPGWTSVSAAGPEREAWDRYFDLMLEKDQDPWRGNDRLFKELVK